uniref:Secreted protein n=1 Tax=Macrostomum lignano TaxID=282301 RepID=A0A1I8F5A9_9PLAT
MAACAILCFIKIAVLLRQRQVRQTFCVALLEGSYCDKQTALKLPERGDAAGSSSGRTDWDLAVDGAEQKAERSAGDGGGHPSNAAAFEALQGGTGAGRELSARERGCKRKSAARVQHFLQERRGNGTTTSEPRPTRDCAAWLQPACKASRRSSNRRILHLLQIMESERLSKWHYVKQDGGSSWPRLRSSGRKYAR